LTITLTELITPVLSIVELRRIEDESLIPIPLEAAIDCKSIFDALRPAETKLPVEATLILLLLQVKEMLVRNSLRALHWIDTRDMLSDGLNKGLVSRKALLEVPATGDWKLLFPSARHSEKPFVKDAQRF